MATILMFIVIGFIFAVVFIGILLFVLSIIDKVSGNRYKFFCKYLGWHKEPKDIRIEGVNFKGKCPRCGKEVMQDSQGNWF